MDDHFGPGGALARALPEFEPRPQQAALAREVESALAAGRHLVAEAGTGVGKSLAYLRAGARSGLRVVVATATKALQEQLLRHDVPLAAAALGREVSSRGRQGPPELPLPPPAARLPAVAAAGRPRRPRLGGDAELARRDRDRRPRGARGRAVGRALGRARGRRRPLRGATLPVRLHLLRGGGPRSCRRGRPRDREPRALLRAPRRRRRGAARARRGRVRRGAPARGVGRLVARRPRLARRPAAARARRRARVPRRPEAAAGAADRPRRACRRASAARRRPAGRAPAPARGAGRGGARADRRARRPRGALHGQGEDLDALGRRALGVAAQVEACLEPGDARAGRLVGAGRARVGARRASPTSCASGCGTKGRPRSSSRRR